MATVVPMPLDIPTKENPGNVNLSKPAAASPTGSSASLPSPSKWAAMRKAFFQAGHTTAVDLTALPPEVREVLQELDVDGSGTLEVSEISAAVHLLKSSREVNRKNHCYIMTLLGLLGVLLAALLGVSYAAAVLAATTKSSNGALTDTNGNALRTAGHAISNVDAGFQPAGASRRLLSSSDDEVPEEFFAHRRKRITVRDAATGRRLSVSAPPQEVYAPKPLILLATVKGQVALEVCRFERDGHYNVVLPKFDPYDEGHEKVVASFKPATMIGCHELDHDYGFSADFGVVFNHGGNEALFHIDCTGPVTADSTCNVYRAFLIEEPPNIAGALHVDRSFERNDTLFNVSADGQIVIPPNNAFARRLEPGVWPPSLTPYDIDESKCPTLTYTTGFPSRTGMGLDNATEWKNAILNTLHLNPTATPAEQAKLLCSASVFCMVGYAVGSGAVFKPDFWNGATSGAIAMSKYIVNDFKGVFNLDNQKAMWNSFKSANVHKCSTTFGWATCLNMNSIVVMTGVNQYTCKAWNVNNFTAGGIEIASSCANSCEMLQWYSAWWKHYRVGGPYDTTQTAPSPFDGAKLPYVQDYCGTSRIVKDSPTKTYYGGYTDSTSRAQWTATPPYTTHPACWVGKKIPLCRSFNIIKVTTC